MAHYFLEGDGKIPLQLDKDGHAYRVILNSKKIFGGSWSACNRYILNVAQDSDLITDTHKTYEAYSLRKDYVNDATKMVKDDDNYSRIPTKVYEFEDEVSYNLANWHSACRALNKFHTGKEVIPLNEEVHESLRNATHHLLMCRRIPVIVSVYSNGEIRLKVKTK